MIRYQFNPAFFILLIAGALTGAFAIIAWRRRPAAGAGAITVAMVGSTIWSLLSAIGIVLGDFETKLFWDRLTYIGILTIPAAWLVFTLEYTGRSEVLAGKRKLWLLIGPALTITAILTNPLHHLYYTSENLVFDGQIYSLVLDHGILFYFHIAYSYSLLVAATVVLLRGIRRSPLLYRQQVIALTCAALVPWAANVFYVANVTLIPGLDMTPLAFTVSGLLVILGAFRYKLLDLTPLARSTLLEVMQDGMLVVDTVARIVDLNPAACRLLGIEAKASIGRFVEEYLRDWPELVQPLIAGDFNSVPKSVHVRREGLSLFDAQISVLTDAGGKTVGRLAILHDLSEMAGAQIALEESEARYRLVVETSPDAISLTDLKGNYLLYNDVTAQLHRFPISQEIIGTPIFDWIIPEDRERGREVSRAAIKTGEIQNWEMTLLRSDGTTFPGEARVTVFRDKRGNPKGFVAILRDISRRKAYEEDVQRMAESERKQRLLAETLLDTNLVLNEQLDFNSVLDRLLEELEKVVPYDSANMTLVEGETARIVRARGYEKFGQDVLEKIMAVTFDLQNTENYRAMRENLTPMVISDTHQYPGWVYLAATSYIRSWVGAPVILNGEAVAFFSLDKTDPDFYTSEHMDIVRAFAAQAGLAMQNARLFEETRELLYREQRLNEILQSIGSSLDLSILLDEILQLGSELLAADASTLALEDAERGGFKISHVHNLPRESLSEFYMYENAAISTQIKQNRQPVLMRDYQNHPRANDVYKSWGIQEAMVVAVQAGDINLGVLAFFLKNKAKRFNERDVMLAEALGRQTGVAIQNAQLYNSVRRRAEEIENLRKASIALTSAMETDRVLDLILTNLERVVPFDSCAVFLLEADHLRVVAARGFPDKGEGIIGQRMPVENALVKEGYETQKVTIIRDVTQDSRFSGWGNSSHIRGWMGVPLLVRGAVVGYLTIDSRQVNAYHKNDAELAEAFGNQAAIALENARLFEKVQKMALTDPLTGIFNRRHFFELARREFYRARRYNTLLSVMMVDVDDLKLVNDAFGHQNGDKLIELIGKTCTQQLRVTDIPARYAGDEFVILLPETDRVEAERVAHRVMDRLQSSRLEDGGTPIPVGISVGIAELDESCLTLEILVDRADQALYMAKQAGKNRTALWDAAASKPVKSRK